MPQVFCLNCLCVEQPTYPVPKRDLVTFCVPSTRWRVHEFVRFAV